MAWRAKLEAQTAADLQVPRPRGAPNCLAGLTFVRTGELRLTGEKEFTTYVYVLGGKATSAVSGKTSYLVKGENAGKTKETAAQKHKTPILTEDEFYSLVRQRSLEIAHYPCDEVSFTYALQLSEPAAVLSKSGSALKCAGYSQAELAAKSATGQYGVRFVANDSGGANERPELWTIKFAPLTIEQMIGNNGAFQTLIDALFDAEHGLIFVSGPPGVGKTLFFEVLRLQHAKNVAVIKIDVNQQYNVAVIRKAIGNRPIAEKRKVVFVFDDADTIETGGMALIIQASRTDSYSKYVVITSNPTESKFAVVKKVAFCVSLRRPQKPVLASHLARILKLQFPKLDQSNQIAAIVAERAGGDVRAALFSLYFASAGISLTVSAAAGDVCKTFAYSVDSSVFEWTRRFFNARRGLHEDSRFLEILREGYFRERFFVPAVFENYLEQVNYQLNLSVTAADALSELDSVQFQQFTRGDWAQSKCGAAKLQALALELAASARETEKYTFPTFPGIIGIDKKAASDVQRWTGFCTTCPLAEREVVAAILQASCEDDPDALRDFNCDVFEEVQDLLEFSGGKDAIKMLKLQMADMRFETQLRKYKKYR